MRKLQVGKDKPVILYMFGNENPEILQINEIFGNHDTL